MATYKTEKLVITGKKEWQREMKLPFSLPDDFEEVSPEKIEKAMREIKAMHYANQFNVFLISLGYVS